MTIDANALAEELKVAAETWSEEAKGGLIVAAARAHLATLPRYKEVEVEGWMVVNRNGTPVCAHQHEMAARNYLEHGGVHGDRVVRLTGTAKVRA